MNQEIEQYRAGFEAWAMGEGINCDYTAGATSRKYDLYETELAWSAWTASKREASTEPSAHVDRHGRLSDELRDLITGMSVSVDVSTGEHDSGNRLFGVVNEVMDDDGDKCGVTLLVYDTTPNFGAAGALTDDAIPEQDQAHVAPPMRGTGGQHNAIVSTDGKFPIERVAALVEAHTIHGPQGKTFNFIGFARDVADEVAARFRAAGRKTNDEQLSYTAYVKKCEAGGILPCSLGDFQKDCTKAGSGK